MRSLSRCLALSHPRKLTQEEKVMVSTYIKGEARLRYEGIDYNFLLGWWVLGDRTIPLSPKEAGLEG